MYWYGREIEWFFVKEGSEGKEGEGGINKWKEERKVEIFLKCYQYNFIG